MPTIKTDWTGIRVRDWLELPLAQWASEYERMSMAERIGLADRLASQVEWMTRVNAYISRRMSGGQHKDAVTAQNRAVRKVRQALGYTYADDKITF